MAYSVYVSNGLGSFRFIGDYEDHESEYAAADCIDEIESTDDAVMLYEDRHGNILGGMAGWAEDAFEISKRLKDEGKIWGSWLFGWRAIHAAEREGDASLEKKVKTHLRTLV